MNTPTRKTFRVKESFPYGTWYTDVGRFHRIAHAQLSRLENLCQQVNSQWPKELGETLKNENIPKKLGQLVDERDLASDVTRIFAAMSVEAFLNFYGVARIGKSDFSAHFERLPIVSKTRKLFLVCDGQSISETDPLIVALKLVSQGRNSLVHHKATQALIDDPEPKSSTQIPQKAQEAVQAMDDFFAEVRVLQPEAKHFLPL